MLKRLKANCTEKGGYPFYNIWIVHFVSELILLSFNLIRRSKRRRMHLKKFKQYRFWCILSNKSNVFSYDFINCPENGLTAMK